MLAYSQPLSNSLDLQGAFAHLSRRGVAGKNLDETLRQLTESAGRMLNIERVSLWGLSTKRSILECVDLYELSKDRHSRGATLLAANYPVYFRALEQGDPIVADDALKHPFTQEFADDYLILNGISALIDSPIHVSGELQGVLCIERVGTHSAWSSVQRLFAHAVANLVTLAIVQNKAALVRDELRDTNARLRALFTGAADAIVVTDAASGLLLDANRQAEKLFDRPHAELVGMALGDLLPPGASTRHPYLRSGVAEPVEGEIINRQGICIRVEMTNELLELGKNQKIVQRVFRRLAKN
jgi:PAS domain S-box-containing protein